MMGLVAAGLVGGVIAGLLGVGGGIIFVPALVVFIGASQVGAEATSLLAILPVAIVGAWRQSRYGNLRLKEGLGLGVLSIAGAIAGVALSNVIPQRGLELGFAVLSLIIAAQMVSRTRRAGAED
jgi:hypothetical protein